jgi:hypothetical protein
VVVGKAQTDLLFDLKSAARGEKDNIWWLHWIFVGKRDASMVYAAFKLCLWWPSNGEMPLKWFLLMLR